MTSHQQPQPTELSTAERLKMTGGAVAQGIRYTLTGEHETARWSPWSRRGARP